RQGIDVAKPNQNLVELMLHPVATRIDGSVNKLRARGQWTVQSHFFAEPPASCLHKLFTRSKMTATGVCPNPGPKPFRSAALLDEESLPVWPEDINGKRQV